MSNLCLMFLIFHKSIAITYCDNNCDAQFLMHTELAQYISKLPSFDHYQSHVQGPLFMGGFRLSNGRKTTPILI